MTNKEIPVEMWLKIQEQVAELIERQHRPANEVVIDDVNLREMLKVSRRTTLDYRKEMGLVYYKIENKIFYFLSDVLEFIKTAGGNHE